MKKKQKKNTNVSPSQLTEKHAMWGVCPDKHLHTLYLNAGSLYPKLNELHALCDIESPEVYSVHGYVMTLVNQRFPSSCIRCYGNRHGGGVALFISDKPGYNV